MNGQSISAGTICVFAASVIRATSEKEPVRFGDFDFGINRGNTLTETINISLGIANFDGAGHADFLALGSAWQP
jgi:hypothetical protein